ncbi:helix-turn-helix domain-containing protein [Phytoactinopolyspora mesophila]|uniref:Helix-turn-helix domain-containing protein n=1 Tax=Phytoactinopolyspora mesophila TaxID=2650750 RepID=A0A7K3LY51_9ACTN|nr:helix-turn-helix domain-containing protein [Phytoactinopolyspora mesophila]NDL55963.1 helix-turn-helix domain-containing protein [Phytoactinopolyspora mesophila]
MSSSRRSPAQGSLGEFLKSRRAELTPARAGIEDWGKRRRVPGLRREEVAHLAGVSVAYYVRLEQGQAYNASNEVLLALARALHLSATETEHLLDLAKPSPMRPSPRTRPEHPHPRALAMLDSIGDRPAVLLGRRNDALAWTPTGHALLAPHLPFDVSDPRTRPSLPRLLFLDPQVRGAYSYWQTEARAYVAHLRRISGKYPDDSRLAELVGELCMKDVDFAAMWATGRVGGCTSGSKHFQHPLVGPLTVEFQIWLQADSPDHRLEVYTPADQPSADALALLNTITQERTAAARHLPPERETIGRVDP